MPRCLNTDFLQPIQKKTCHLAVPSDLNEAALVSVFSLENEKVERLIFTKTFSSSF